MFYLQCFGCHHKNVSKKNSRKQISKKAIFCFSSSFLWLLSIVYWIQRMKTTKCWHRYDRDTSAYCTIPNICSQKIFVRCFCKITENRQSLKFFFWNLRFMPPPWTPKNYLICDCMFSVLVWEVINVSLAINTEWCFLIKETIHKGKETCVFLDVWFLTVSSVFRWIQKTRNLQLMFHPLVLLRTLFRRME